MRHSNFNQFSLMSISNNGGDSIFIAKSELPGSEASFNIFSDLKFSGNRGGWRVNDKECIGNVFLRSGFAEDKLASAKY